MTAAQATARHLYDRAEMLNAQRVVLPNEEADLGLRIVRAIRKHGAAFDAAWNELSGYVDVEE